MSVQQSKTRADYDRLKKMADGQPSDWLKSPWDMHHWVDMFVESSRHAPYLMGHWWAVYFPVSIAAIAALVYLLVR